MEKLLLSDARKIAELLKGERVPMSQISERTMSLMRQEGIIEVTARGSRRTLRIAVSRRVACRAFLAQQYGVRCSLEEWIHAMESSRQKNSDESAPRVSAARAEWVNYAGDSKFRQVHPFHGFLVNSYTPIDATLHGKPFCVCPPSGSMVFVNAPDLFNLPSDVVVMGMENAENFMHIDAQRYLFDRMFPDKRILFVCRYPQQSVVDLRSWLKRIPNPYVHFGDFDLAGIHIFLSEFRAFLGDKASFLIPDDIEQRLKNGNARLYDQQYAKFKDLTTTVPNLHHLIELIHRYHAVYEQEGYIMNQNSKK